MISALFCSVNLGGGGGGIIAALPAQEFVPRTVPYRQTKLNIILTIVVLTELQLFLM